MTDWQPIETAKKDGTPILGWWDTSALRGIVQWDMEAAEWRDEYNPAEAPTHWQPLPDPPDIVKPIPASDAP